MRGRLRNTASKVRNLTTEFIHSLTTLSLLFALSTPNVAAVAPAATVEAKASAATPDTYQTIGKDVEAKDYEPISDPSNVERFVEDYFADIPLLAKIAGCESHFRQVGKSGNIIRGEVNHYDVGVMQINELYHADIAAKLGYDLYSLDGNVAYARYLYEKSGAAPWVSSKACWGKATVSPEIARK